MHNRKRPIPISLKSVKLLIKRDRSGFTKKLYPLYSLFLLINNTEQHFILASQKMQILRSSYYAISTKLADFSSKSDNFIGKVRSNFIGSKFSIFGKGENPNSSTNINNYRKQYCSIKFVFFILL